MTAVQHVVYLHGFASSPGSSKAQRFREELARHGVGMSCPDLNLPAFETLTTTRMLAQVEDIIASVDASPVALVGSSLGGFVALHAAARDAGRRIDRVILLAPAVDFGGNRLRQFDDHDIDEWRRRGYLDIHHYAHDRVRRIGVELFDDSIPYDAFAIDLAVPVLIFQGREDVVVTPGSVIDWVRGRANVDLRLVDDDHQLARSMDLVWRESEKFLGLTPAWSARRS